MFKKNSLLGRLLVLNAFYAFDPEDQATKDAIAAAVAEGVAALTANNKTLIAELRAAKRKGEINPEDHAALERSVDDLTAQLADANKTIKANAKVIEDGGKALQTEQEFNQRLLVDNGLSAALLEAGVKNPAHLKGAAALIRASHKVEVVAEGTERVATVGGKKLGEFVKEWAAGDEGKAFATAPHNSGGAAPGSGGGQGGAAKGNMGGTPAERAAALRAQFPELN